MNAKYHEVPFCAPSVSYYAPDVAEAIRAGRVGPGLINAAFARELSERLDAYVVLTSSGTAALQVAAKLLCSGTAYVPSYGFIATANAFASMGCRVASVAISSWGLMSPASLELAPLTVGDVVCPVDFSGYCGPELRHIKELCTQKGVVMVEDAACGFGHALDGRAAGTIGDVGILSFSVPKRITTGQGGAFITKVRRYAEAARDFIDQGDARRYGRSTEPGCNLRMADVNAALGLAQLHDADEILAKANSLRQLLEQGLEKELGYVPLCMTKLVSGVPLHNVVVSKRRDELLAILRSNGVDARAQYCNVFAHLAYANIQEFGDPYWSNTWSERAVYLPFGLGLTDFDIEYVAHIVGAGMRQLKVTEQ